MDFGGAIEDRGKKGKVLNINSIFLKTGIS